MNFKVIRRGFTVVEIVIVIAVIAVLAGVMVPTISNIVKKAQQSVDEQLVNNLNKILMAEEVIEGKNPYMHAAVLDLAENGYDLDSLKMSDEDNILVWDQNIDRFLIVYMSNSTTVSKKYYSSADEEYFLSHLSAPCFWWRIFTTNDYGNDGKLKIDQVFSIYWGETTRPSFGNLGSFSVGLDLGYYEENYVFTTEESNNSMRNWLVFNRTNTIIHGNINDLLVEAQGIKHFGKINGILHLDLTVNSIATTYTLDKIYHEYGFINQIKLREGLSSLRDGAIFSAEQGAKFKQSLDEIKGIVGGESHFKNNGAEFNASF